MEVTMWEVPVACVNCKQPMEAVEAEVSPQGYVRHKDCGEATMNLVTLLRISETPQ